MKRTFLLALILFVFIGLTNAQKPEIVGTWLLERVEMDDEIQQPFMVNEFQKGGAMLMMGMEVATWKFNKKGDGIVLESDFDKDFDGEMLILSYTEKDLVFDKESLSLENNGIVYKATRKVSSSHKIERLTFGWEDFFTDTIVLILPMIPRFPQTLLTI